MLAPPLPSAPATSRVSTRVWVTLAALATALLLILLGSLGTVSPPPRAPATARVVMPPIAALTGPPPAVAPIVYADMTPEQARVDNALHPFSGEAPRAAPRFVFAGTEPDRIAARTCLAAAVLYEAGDDARGEQAVAQVVLNRVRHPAFPKTVCGVVFQGAERTTGCQFTFTCDGALARPPAEAAWRRARDIADAALSGHVDKTVGAATHYHADYVVPYWRDSLNKLVQVGAHLFYRWPGWWGSAAALTGRLQPSEPLDPRLVALAGPEAAALPLLVGDQTADAPPPPPLVSLSVDGVPKGALKGAIVRAKDESVAQYALQLEPGGFPGSWALAGLAICAEHPDCLVLGWTGEADTPRAVPVPPLAMRTLAFMYRKSAILGIAQPAWDCRRFPRSQRAQCLPGTAPAGHTLPMPALTFRPPPAPASN